MSGMGLSANNIYAATTSAHQTNLVDGSSDHTWCPAVSTGVTGYSSSWSYLSYGTCGPGYHATSFCACKYDRGTAYNPNVSTFDYISYAYWFW